MRKLYILIALSSLVSMMVSCSDDKDDKNDLQLERSSIEAASLNTAYHVAVLGGSGDYSASISDQEIADVNIRAAVAGGKELVVITKKEGDAIIMVTDNQSGVSKECLLIMRRGGDTFYVRELRYGINTERMHEEILCDMNSESGVTLGKFHKLIYNGYVPDSYGEWSLYDVMIGGPAELKETGTFEYVPLIEYKTNYNLVPINNQIYLHKTLKIQSPDGNVDYDVFWVRGSATRLNMTIMHVRFYEDLTEYYKTKYPTAGVRGVVRVQILDCTPRI